MIAYKQSNYEKYFEKMSSDFLIEQKCKSLSLIFWYNSSSMNYTETITVEKLIPNLPHFDSGPYDWFQIWNLYVEAPMHESVR